MEKINTLHTKPLLPHMNGQAFSCACGYRFYFGKSVMMEDQIGTKRKCPDCSTKWLICVKFGGRFFALEQ